jgi:hypothetical protein
VLLLNAFSSILFDPNTKKNQSPKLSNEDITIITPENRTYTDSAINYYMANDGFDYDETGANPRGWDVIPNPSTSVRVIDELGGLTKGHKKVVEFNDSSDSYEAAMEKTFEAQENGTIEYWVRGDNYLWRFYLEVFENDTLILRIRIHENTIEYYDGSYHDHPFGELYNNLWYHIRVKIFNNDSAILYVNGDPYSRGLIGTPNGFNKVKFCTNDGEIPGFLGRYYHLDAVGFSWNSSYTVGDNSKEGLLFNYETAKDLNWTGYSLDGQPNITIHDDYYIPMPEDGVHTIQVFGNDSLGSVYQSAVRYFTIRPLSIYSPENRTYTNLAPITEGYYQATYGFENNIYKKNPAGWTIEEYPYLGPYMKGPTYVEIIDEVDKHKKVVQFIDLDYWDPSEAGMETTFDDRENGTIEFWARGADVDLRFVFEIYENDTLILRIRFDDKEIEYNIGGDDYSEVMDVNDNTWYHFRVDISVPSDSVDLYINGNQANYSGSLLGTPSIMNKIRFHTNDDEVGAIYCLDAVGFSWDPNYNVGDNFAPNGSGTGWLLDVEKGFIHDWMGYSLDGQSNITIFGDTVIPIPEEGHHTIQVFAHQFLGTFHESNIVHYHVYWDATVPDPPTDPKLDQEIGHIYLDWKEPANNNAPIIRYNIYRGNVSGGDKELIGFTSNLYYDDIDAGDYIGHRFYYIIRAVNILGESNDSDEVNGKAYDTPFIDWDSPEEDARLVFPYNASYPGENSSRWVIFNFTYDPGGLDSFDLKLNKYNYENVSNSVILYCYDDLI